MQTTTNYGLRKPDSTDNVKIDDFNYNSDITDQQMKDNENALAAHQADYANYKRLISMGGMA